jgi:hypothetical protein
MDRTTFEVRIQQSGEEVRLSSLQSSLAVDRARNE